MKITREYITIGTLAIGMILSFGKLQWGMNALADGAEKNVTIVKEMRDKDQEQDKQIVQIQQKVENIDRDVQQVQVKQEDNTKLLNQILGKLGG